MKHTPGPWTVQFETNDFVETETGSKFEFKAATIMSREGLYLADVRAMKVENFLQDFDQYDANKKLIAAAPELLDALTRLVNVLEQYGDERIESQVAAAYSAINKAVG